MPFSPAINVPFSFAVDRQTIPVFAIAPRFSNEGLNLTGVFSNTLPKNPAHCDLLCLFSCAYLSEWPKLFQSPFFLFQTSRNPFQTGPRSVPKWPKTMRIAEEKRGMNLLSKIKGWRHGLCNSF